MKIIKRNGQEAIFDEVKITNAIIGANKEVVETERLSEEEIDNITNDIKYKCQKMKRALSVEEIQNLVEDELMKLNAFSVARKYITYRFQRALARQSNTTDDQILSLIECANEEVKQENSNKNPTVNSVQRDYMAGEVSKDLTRRILLPEDIVKAHDEGLIHFHDADYFSQHMHNCDLVNLEDMLQNGTVISETMIEKPKSFSTACNVATQIIAQVASSQYGGQSITLSHLAPFVDVSRQKFRKEVKEEFETIGLELDDEKINALAEERLKKEITKGVQTIQYQVVTLMTTNGQAPFITVFMYLNEVPEGRLRDDLAMIIEETLKQRMKGVKNEKGVYITPAFPKLIYERLDLCYRALMCRHERLKGTPSDVAPILWQHGALARLKKGETIDKLLYGGYSTISLGYAGLYECVKYMTGKSHTDPSATPFAIEVMQHLNDACAKWKEKENIDFSLYGTPIESTTYKFAKCLQKRFGKIEGVTDKNYITNSYHIHVTEHINAFDKLTFESQFQKLSPGGAISYVEVPDMQDNIDAVLAVMKHIYNNIMYAELNTKSDYCMACGYDGEIQIEKDENGKLIWVCPNCGNKNQDMMSVARRTCGYIGTQFWNQGRTQEIKERVLHL